MGSSSELNIYDGLLPQPKNRILGHEFIGPGVGNLANGDRVVVPFPIACGRCFFCTHELPVACEVSNQQNYGPDAASTLQSTRWAWRLARMSHLLNDPSRPADGVKVVLEPEIDFAPGKTD